MMSIIHSCSCDQKATSILSISEVGFGIIRLMRCGFSVPSLAAFWLCQPAILSYLISDASPKQEGSCFALSRADCSSPSVDVHLTTGISSSSFLFFGYDIESRQPHATNPAHQEPWRTRSSPSNLAPRSSQPPQPPHVQRVTRTRPTMPTLEGPSPRSSSSLS